MEFPFTLWSVSYIRYKTIQNFIELQKLWSEFAYHH